MSSQLLNINGKYVYFFNDLEKAIEETKMRWLENEALSFGYGEMTPLSAEKGIFHAVAAMTAKA